MATKKKYSVNVHYDMVFQVDNIIASSEEEAIEIAMRQTEDMDLNDADCCNSEGCVTSEENTDIEDDAEDDE